MELQFQTIARCHPRDIWEVLQRVEEWQQHTSVFGQAGWGHGGPWGAERRFFFELNLPRRMDLEAVVQKTVEPHEIVILCHGSGIAVEQWLHFIAAGPSQTMIRTEAVL